jgi:hypothetical protein
MSKVTVIDNVLPDNLHKMCYELITQDSVWQLSMSSAYEAVKIAGTTLFEYQKVDTNSKSQTLAAVIYQMVRARMPSLPNDLRRIQLGAKAAFQDDMLHQDSERDDRITVLYHLNLNWKKEYGGETVVEGEKFDYTPNRALVYKSNLVHGGKAGTGPLFRTYINYVVAE